MGFEGLISFIFILFSGKKFKKRKIQKKKLRHWLKSKNKEVPRVKEKPSQARETKGSSCSLANRWWPVWARERVSGAAEGSNNGASR